MTDSAALRCGEARGAAAKSPICDDYDGMEPNTVKCTAPAEYAIGVRFDCCDGGWQQVDYCCARHVSDNYCVDCGGAPVVSEPVRLRGSR